MDHLDSDHSIRHIVYCSKIMESIVRTRNVVKTYALTINTMTFICTTSCHLPPTSIIIIEILLDPAPVSLEDICEWSKNIV